MSRSIERAFQKWWQRGLLASACLIHIGLALAAPGDLDPTFGNGGRVSVILGGRQVQINSVVQQADGKIVLAGMIGGFDFIDSTQLLLVRLNPDGTLDTTFDQDGIVVGANPDESAAVVIQLRNGKLAVAGRNADTANIVLWRFAAYGSPDAGFGVGGSTSFDQGEADYASGLVEQASGKLVVAGTVSGSGGTWDRDMMLARFHADGQLDTAFGSAGTAVFHFAVGAHEDGYALLQQPDGKLVMTGNRYVAVHDSRGGTVAVVRSTENGLLDPSFGGDGVQEIFLDYHSWEGSFVFTWKQSAVLQDDGKIVVNGMVGADGQSSGFVMRLKPDGDLDPAFDEDGIVFSGGGFQDAMVDVAIQPDGKIVTAGSQDYWWWSGDTQEMRLRQFAADGRIDTSFGVGGTSIADFQDMVPWVSTRAMVRQADGKIVVVGDGIGVPEHRPALAVARFGNNNANFAGLIGLLGGKNLVAASEAAAELIVRRTGGATGAVSVAYETVDRSALAGSDYVPQVGRLDWADGESSPKSITLALLDDGNQEQERFDVRLFDPAGGAMLALQTATIWSGNIPELGLTLDRTTIGEADGSLTLSVSRSGSASGVLSVDFETYPITAKSGSDFASAYGTLTWADGDIADKAITVSIVNDGVNEGDEWFGISLSDPTDGAILGTHGNTTVTIVDDEAVSPPPPAPPPAPPPPTAGDGGGGATGFELLLLLALLNSQATGRWRRSSPPSPGAILRRC